MNSLHPPDADPRPALNSGEFESARRKAYWRILPLLFISYMVAYVDRQNVAVAKLTMAQDLPAFDDAVIGLGAGIFFWGYLLLEVPGTLLVERWSARKWIARIMFTWGIMAGLTAFVKTPFQFYVVRFLLGLAEAGFFPGVIVYLSHWFTSRDRARALAIFFCASPLAQIVSPLVNRLLLPIGVSPEGLAKLHMGGQEPVAHILGMAGWQWVYVLWAVPAIVLSLIVFLVLTDKPRQARWLTPGERGALETALENERALTSGGQRTGVLKALLHPRVLLLAAGMFCAVTATYSVEFFMPTILKEWYSLDLSKLTWLIILPPALALIIQPLTGWSSDHHGERRWHAVIPILVSAVCMALLPFSHGNKILTVCLFMFLLAGCKAYMPAFWSLPNLFLTNAAAAGSIGLINSIGNLGGSFGPTILGSLRSATGSFHAGLYFLSGCLLLSAILIFWIATVCRKRAPAG